MLVNYETMSTFSSWKLREPVDELTRSIRMFRAPAGRHQVQVTSSHLLINLYTPGSGPHLGSSRRTGERELHRLVVRTRAQPS